MASQNITDKDKISLLCNLIKEKGLAPFILFLLEAHVPLYTLLEQGSLAMLPRSWSHWTSKETLIRISKELQGDL